jgi:uncharacterized protein DUF2786
MQAPLDKVHKLIALSSSPYEEEARTAAIMACRLIREHGFVVISAGSKNAKQQNREEYQDDYRKTREDNPEWRFIFAKFGGRCKVCHKYYDVDDPVYWKKGAGCIHEDCYGG